MNLRLITTALEHAKHNLLLPLRETTARFLSSPRTSVEYNMYLQSISHIPFRTPETTRTVKSILAHIDQLNDPDITVSTKTYARLIRPSFTPVGLLTYLHQRLTVLYPPPLPLPILLSFLDAYSKLDDHSNAALFFSQIQHHPHADSHTRQRANTLLLSAQSKQQAAYDILTSSSSSSSVPHNSSASLHVLSKDLSVPAPQLIQSFLRLISSLPDPPLLPLYTSLINGLILRKKYYSASVSFNKLLKASPSLDIPSLSAGINALTRLGKPHVAFQLLQSHYPPLLLTNNPSLPLITFLTALNRISRPDISTLLFFLYPSLYGPNSPPPSSLLLNLLLQASRTGYKMDLSIQNAKSLIPQNIKRLLLYFHPNSKSFLSKLNFRTSTLIQKITASLGNNLTFDHLISKPLPPFGKQHPHLPPHTHASNLILSHLGHPSRGGLRLFISSSSYQSLPSITCAQLVFLRVLAGLGIGPSIQPPATSFIPSPSPSPTPQPTLDSFTHLFTHQKQLPLIPYTPTHYHNPSLWQNFLLDNKPYYPSIIPTNSNFFNYLTLLSLSPRLPTIHISPNGLTSQEKAGAPLPPPSPHETPLILAWMRTLSIQPSNSTLALALVLWGKVCAHVDASAPKEKLGESQYVALVDYLRDWVGEDRLPHWRTLEKWRGIVVKMRRDE